MAAPYWSSDDKVTARWRLATVFALTLGTTGISVGFNFLGRDFFNALASMIFRFFYFFVLFLIVDVVMRVIAREMFRFVVDKDQEQFSKQLLYYLAAFAGGIPVSTLLLFF